MDRLDRFDLAFQRLCERVVTWAVGSMMLLAVIGVSINVIGRYVFRAPILGLYTYIGLLLVPIAFWSYAFCWYKRGTFITVNILPLRLKGKAQWINQFIIFLLVATIFGAMLTWGVTMAAWESFTTGQFVGETGFLSPAWPWKFVMVPGMVLFEIRVVLDLVQMVRKRAIIPFNRGSTPVV